MATNTKQKDYLTVLPPELLLAIGEELPFRGVLRLRAVLPKGLQGIVADMLKGARTNLCVSPSERSLRNFTNICRTPFFQEHIEHIIFVPIVFDAGYTGRGWASDIKEYVEAAWPGEIFDDDDAHRSYQIYRDLTREHRSSVPLPKLGQTGVRPRDTFSLATAAVLSGGMQQLPRLKSIHITEQIELFALNVSTVFVSEKLVVKDPARRAAYRYFPKKTAGIDTLFTAIAVATDNGDVSIKRLSLGMSLSSQICGEIQPATAFDIMDIGVVFQNLSALTISCTDFHDLDVDHNDDEVWPHMIANATRLQQLTLFLGEGRPSCDSLNCCVPGEGLKVLNQLLAFGYFPWLSTLKIYGDHEEPSDLSSTNLQIFLGRHKNTLQHIAIRDVILIDELSTQNIGWTMHSFLDKVRANSENLKSFQMTLGRVRPHTSTERYGWHEEHLCLCEMYHPLNNLSIHRSMFDELAKYLEVSWSEEGWQFGEYVMRK